MRVFVLAAAALVACMVPAAAQRVPIDTNPTADELRNIITFQVDNDFFNPIYRTDRDYSNGLRLGWLSPALPDLPDSIAALTNLPTFFGEDPVTSVTRRFGISVGQNICPPAQHNPGEAGPVLVPSIDGKGDGGVFLDVSQTLERDVQAFRFLVHRDV